MRSRGRPRFFEAFSQSSEAPRLIGMQLRMLGVCCLSFMHVCQGASTECGSHEFIIAEGYERHGLSMARTGGVEPASEFVKHYWMDQCIQARTAVSTVCKELDVHGVTCRMMNAMLGVMEQTKQRYLVNDIEVTLVRDERGTRWECGQCRGECEHILQAAAWMTLQSWAGSVPLNLH
jgi:hypothetical protein